MLQCIVMDLTNLWELSLCIKQCCGMLAKTGYLHDKTWRSMERPVCRPEPSRERPSDRFAPSEPKFKTKS
ncbi:hypothetical protein BN1708_002658 [Verticillium longisporum]|uniref:Uncharacterized protein n=1 Tax=Verticillium longisporum TaxID=100787 RepID=A0A0G4KX75_VERLO|nr:hypothetical protein BN1708_002658 [Verticillium longisporum]